MGMFDFLGGGNKERKRARELMERDRDEWQRLETPEYQFDGFNEYDYLGDFNPELETLQGNYTPEMEAALSQQDSEMRGVKTDPRLKDAQMNALSAMQGIYKSGGMNLQDKANLAKVQNQAASEDRGRREAILQNMQARGMGGSGAELLAQLQSNQAATDRSAQGGLDVAAGARSRALQAMIDSGNMSGNMRGQDFSEQSRVAEAQDAINRFNTQNAQGVAGRNVGARNQGQQYNLDRSQDVHGRNVSATNQAGVYNHGNRQNTANGNVDLRNKGIQYGNDLKTQTFQNNVTKRNGVSQGNAAVANARNANAQAADSQASGMVEGAVRVGAAVYTGGASEAAFAAADAAKKKKEQGG